MYTVIIQYCSAVEVLTLALLRGHSLMAVWQTGSRLWQILLNNTLLSTDGLPYNKLHNMMSKVVASCNTDDAKILFEALLSEEVCGNWYSTVTIVLICQTLSHLLFVKQCHLIVTSKMSTDTRKSLNHHLSRVSVNIFFCFKHLVPKFVVDL